MSNFKNCCWRKNRIQKREKNEDRQFASCEPQVFHLQSILVKQRVEYREIQGVEVRGIEISTIDVPAKTSTTEVMGSC